MNNIDTYKLNFKLLSRLTGDMLHIMSILMLIPLIISWVTHDGVALPLLFSLLSMLVVGTLLRFTLGRHATYSILERDSFWITSVIWIVTPLLGSLPYLFSGVFSSFTNAVFESFSGFTTTGASMVTNPQLLPTGILVWRSLTQWVGGLGLILFLVALIRGLQEGGNRLYAAEFSGTVQRKLHPHISNSVGRMWRIYLALTLVMIGALIIAGNPVIDSLCLAMSTISTGGFTTHAAGMSYYNEATLIIVTIFMFLSGINVALLYQFVTFHPKTLFKDEEFRLYIFLYVITVIACLFGFLHAGNPFKNSLGYSLFHVASTFSTCGFYIDSPHHWSMLVSVITFFFVFIGASAGSVGGGMKMKRIMIIFQYVRHYLLRVIHPQAVFTVRVNGNTIGTDYINRIFAFVFLYLLFVAGGALVLTCCGCDIPDAVCMAAANMSNLGPSPLINNLGAELNYMTLPAAAKWTLMVLMLAGRIEIFALIAIFSPAYWRKK